jgi:hypothetical protein
LTTTTNCEKSLPKQPAFDILVVLHFESNPPCFALRPNRQPNIIKQCIYSVRFSRSGEEKFHHEGHEVHEEKQLKILHVPS